MKYKIHIFIISTFYKVAFHYHAHLQVHSAQGCASACASVQNWEQVNFVIMDSLVDGSILFNERALNQLYVGSMTYWMWEPNGHRLQHSSIL